MSDLQDLVNSLLAHAPALTLAIGAVIAIGVISVIVILLRPKKPIPDPVAEQPAGQSGGRPRPLGTRP